MVVGFKLSYLYKFGSDNYDVVYNDEEDHCVIGRPVENLSQGTEFCAHTGCPHKTRQIYPLLKISQLQGSRTELHIQAVYIFSLVSRRLPHFQFYTQNTENMGWPGDKAIYM